MVTKLYRITHIGHDHTINITLSEVNIATEDLLRVPVASELSYQGRTLTFEEFRNLMKTGWRIPLYAVIPATGPVQNIV